MLSPRANRLTGPNKSTWLWLLTPLAASYLVLVWLGGAWAGEPPKSTAWPLETIYLKNGGVLRGLVIEDTPRHVRLHYVRQPPGRPTVVLTATINKSEVRRIELLDAAGRQQLQERLQSLDPTGQIEKQRMEELALERTDWQGQPNQGWKYEAEEFTLYSNAAEEIVRRAAVRLDQIYTAYSRFFPPRHKAATPTQILLVSTVEEYRAILNQAGPVLKNPALYDPSSNRIICGSDLRRMGAELDVIRRTHQQQRAELSAQKAAYLRLYKGNKRELDAHLARIAADRQRIDEADRRNEQLFDRATQQLFATLYHEAFHAYVANYVYPPNRPPGELPRWLNEGLAQVFETAIVEAGELRVGHADRDRLAQVRELLRQGKLVSVAELLKSNRGQFVVTHAGDRPGSDRYYLASWAVAFYLTFERGLIGTPALDRFVQAVTEGGDPLAAFAGLIGQPLEAFERDLTRYLQSLQPDGSVIDHSPGK